MLLIHRLCLLLICWGTFVSVAWADYYTCGNDTRLVSTQYADPSTPPPCPAPYAQFRFGGADQAAIQAQEALVKTIPRKYLKVAGGLVTEKTPAEKTNVDTAIQVQDDIAAAKDAEVTSNDFCNNLTKESIASKITTLKAAAESDIAALDSNETLINTITNISSAVTVLKQVNNAHQVALGNLNTRYFNGFHKLADCLWARTR